MSDVRSMSYYFHCGVIVASVISCMFSALIHKIKCHNTTVLPGHALSSIFMGSFEVNGSLHHIGAAIGGTNISKEKLLCD